MFKSGGLGRGSLVLALCVSAGCVGSAGEPASSNHAAKAGPAQDGSQAELARSSQLAKKPELDSSLEDWRFLRLEPAQRVRQALAQPEPCRLSGTAETFSWPKLYSSAGGSDYAVTLEDFDVIGLELPARADERVKVEISYPFQARGYLDSDSGLVVTVQRVDVSPGHLWLDPQTSVHAFGVAGGRVTLQRGETNHSQPAVKLRVPCALIGLSSARPIAAADPQAEITLLSGRVPLFAAPAGPVIGQLEPEFPFNVRVLGRAHGWVHVTSSNAGVTFAAVPYELDAWVNERSAPKGKPGFSVGMLAPPSHAPTHVTRALLPLRLQPSLAAPVVLQLTAGVRLIVGSERNGLRRIRLQEAHGHNEGNDFWVTSADLSERARLM